MWISPKRNARSNLLEGIDTGLAALNALLGDFFHRLGGHLDAGDLRLLPYAAYVVKLGGDALHPLAVQGVAAAQMVIKK